MGTHRIQCCDEAGEASVVLQADVSVVVQRVLLPVVLEVVPRLWVLHAGTASGHKLQRTPAIFMHARFCT